MAKRTRPIIVSLSQLLEEFDLVGFSITARWLNRLVKEKKFPRVAHGKYNLLDCFRWLLKYLNDQHVSELQKFKVREEHEARKAKFQADLLELRLELERGQTIPIKFLREILEPPLLAIHSIMLGIPKHAERELGKEAKIFLDPFIIKILNELASIPNKLEIVERDSPSNQQEFFASEASSSHDDKSMGRSISAIKPRSKRRKRSMANEQSGIST